jgi:uncharacterized membrane protein affecting hemolysin expression
MRPQSGDPSTDIAMEGGPSLRQRLRRIVLVVLSTVLLATAVLVVAFQVYSGLQATTSRLEVVADIVARNATASLEFDDETQAALLLNSLRAEPTVETGLVIRPDRSVLAAYGNMTELRHAAAMVDVAAAGGLQHHVELHAIEVVVPVTLQRETIGHIYVRASLQQLYDGLLRTLLILLGTIAAGGTLAVLLSDRLQRRIVAPLL